MEMEKNKQRSENGNTPEVSKRRKKAPREFLDISAVEEENEMTEEAAIQSMKDELSKPYKEQDQPLMIKALRVTFKSRRLFIQSCTADGKAYMKTIVEKYPLLKYADFIQKEFFQLKPALSPEKSEENWVEMLGKLDTVFENVEGEDKELGDEQEEILRLIKEVMDSTYFKATKKDVPLITEVQATKPSIIKTTTPCLVIVRNEDLRLNTTYISHEGVSIDIGKNIKKAIDVLFMLFFVLDLSYPKCHQLLGFLQIALLKDCSPFHRGANLIKFEKKYEQSSGRNNSDEL